MKWVVIGVLILGGFIFGRWSAAEPPAIVTQVDTVPLPALLDSIDALEIQTNGLRAHLEDVQNRPPTVIVRADTVMIEEPPDTVLLVVGASGSQLAWAPLIRQADSLWAPELHRADIGDCDDGWSVGTAGLVCDPARFGHLWFTATTRPALGARWQPTFRNRYSVGVEYGLSRKRWDLMVGVRAFQ